MTRVDISEGREEKEGGRRTSLVSQAVISSKTPVSIHQIRRILPHKKKCRSHRTQLLNLNLRHQPLPQLPRSPTIHINTHFHPFPPIPISTTLSLPKMSPPLPLHTLPTLESQINLLPNGKPRKPPVKLSDCALKELVQYKCNISELGKKGADPVVICEPFVRLLRM